MKGIKGRCYIHAVKVETAYSASFATADHHGTLQGPRGGPSAINVAFTCSAGSAMSSSVRFAGKGPDSIVSKRHKSLHGDPV